MILTCPDCGEDTIWEDESLEENEGSTADCSGCDQLLLIKDRKAVSLDPSGFWITIDLPV